MNQLTNNKAKRLNELYVNNRIGFPYGNQELDCDFGIFLRHPSDLLRLEPGPAILIQNLLHLLRP